MKFAGWRRAPQTGKKRTRQTVAATFKSSLGLEMLEYRWNLTPVLAGLVANDLVIGSPTNAATIVYTATFSEPVSGVDPTDFALALTGTVGTALTQVHPVNTSVYKVTISGITGNGTLGLNLVANGSIQDALSNPLVNNFSGQTYAVDYVSPYVQSIQPLTPAAPNNNPGSVVYTVTFSESVTGVNTSDFALALAGTNGTVTQVQPVNASDYQVTVSGTTGNGTLGLNLADNGSIHDLANNPLRQVNAPSSFQTHQDIPTTGVPSAIVMADVNGDGSPDVITADHDAGVASVRLGNGNGSFQAAQSYATGATPSAVAVADVNGDGKLDLITANEEAQTVSVLLGNGNGTFQPKQDYATGGTPKSLAVADLNGDGRPDLVTANHDVDTVSVLLGNGNGTFQPQQAIAAGAGATAVAVADVNRDGRPDLITANLFADTVSVLLGNGNGTFQPKQDFAAGAAPRSVTVADVNGDGKPDLITANLFADTVSVLLGNGNGTFHTSQEFSSGWAPFSIAVADANGDGHPDLITANLYSNNASVLLGNGNGSFQPKQDFAAGAGAYSLAVADVNGDGRPDLLTANLYANSVSVLLNSGTGDFIGQLYPINQASPTVQSIARTNPAGSETGPGSVTYTVTFNHPVTGVDPTDFALALTGSVGAAAPIVSGSGSVYTVTVDAVTGDGTLGLNIVNDGTIRDSTLLVLAGGFTGEVYVVSTPTSVVGRHIFYNQSSWDGNSSAINPVNDNLAIATDKVPYLPGAGLAVYSNITSFTRGITGIMIDLSSGVNHTGISASDFFFQVGNDNSPAEWDPAPAPSAISVIPGGGVGGSDRITITWASGSIANKWLEVIVLPTEHTGLTTLDVFFWGNKVGDSGTSPGAGTFDTTTVDAAQVFANLGGSRPIVDLRDYNRSKDVATSDAAVVFANLGSIIRLNIPAVESLAREADPAVALDDGSSTVASALTATPGDASRAFDSQSVRPQVANRLSDTTLRSERADGYFQQTIVGDPPRLLKGNALSKANIDALVGVDALLDDLLARRS